MTAFRAVRKLGVNAAYRVALLFGGGGGNRTRVRKSSTVRTTCLAWLFGSRLAPANRQVDAWPAASTDPRGKAAMPRREADVNDTAPDK